MFRSVSTQERIAGNVREKERALHAAESAEQYGEWALTQGNALLTGSTVCGPPLLNASAGEFQICSNTLTSLGIDNIAQVPWTAAGGPVGFTVTPAGMVIGDSSATTGIAMNVGGSSNNSGFYAPPVFYIADIGVAADGLGEAYQIDAYGYGGSANAVAVVESVYEVSKGVTNLGGL
jgi:type IV pilus assembly protein PilX